MDGAIKLTVENFIATVVMDRPPVNAQNHAFREEMIGVFDSLTDRDDVRVAILTGTGTMFSAGADMKERPNADVPGEYWKFNRGARECFNAIHECAKPVIAAVNGPALGAGAGLVAACDIILCSDNAQFGMPEIDVGLAGGAAMLQTLFGHSRARRMFYTGWRVPAAELYRTGVVECCVPLEQLLPEATKLACPMLGNRVSHRHALSHPPTRPPFDFCPFVRCFHARRGSGRGARLARLSHRRILRAHF